ncbi:unnamed protein product [marine sediment metagenome]|uniref:Uncharacterized protein n=1 Tax=marine sediment metagenome TaxID=412755 RepID=X0SWA2_9ZZZZ
MKETDEIRAHLLTCKTSDRMNDAIFPLLDKIERMSKYPLDEAKNNTMDDETRVTNHNSIVRKGNCRDGNCNRGC